MTQTQNEYFGGQVFAGLQEKSDVLWPLLKNDPKYCCHGRIVGLADMESGGMASNLKLMLSLAKLVGAGICDCVPIDEMEELQSSLQASGFSTDRMEVWYSDNSTIDTARDIIASATWPTTDDIAWVDGDTPHTELQKLDEFTQEHGTSLPMGSFLRGVEKPAACAYVKDSDGSVLVTSASAGHFHDAHPNSDMAYWGMLATREDKRGQGAALTLGAQTIVDMHERHGFVRFFTAIKQGNTASESLCAKLGFSRQKAAVLIAIDPSVFPKADG